MKKMILITLFLSPAILVSQEKYLANIDETKSMSKKATELFYQSEIAEMFTLMTPYWAVPGDKIKDMADKTIKYKEIIKERFGNPLGTVKVSDQFIKGATMREVYFVRYKKSAIRLIFIYYLSDQGWTINTFEWDDKFTSEFK